MKYFSSLSQTIALTMVLFLASCSGGGNQKKKPEATTPVQVAANTVKVNDESQKLLKYLEETGDYVNGRNFPSLIKASAVNKELGSNIHIIDLRDPKSFAKGHIKGAVNVEFTKIPDYFTNTIKPFGYSKIVMVCYAGQIASYTTSLLRLMGYGNVYALRWGMSGWNKDFAKDSWLTAVSDKYADKLELTENQRAEANDFPQLNTGKSTGEEIMAARFKSVFAAGYEDAFTSAEKVFDQPKNFYTINYERKDKYDAGHIPGAVRYKPNGTLGIVSEMESIPSGKDVAVYCGTGHNSGFVTAYLRLFGYNAKTIPYGNNAFMHKTMMEKREKLSWLPFTEAEIDNLPYVKN
ncbi:MAG TPA: rhodanese-like domain-containing protein [Prolixibacteraceae bacterium]|nr:rhodanese-like domain-containing protein [Prolixibacteraceae bacterium]